MLTLLKEEIDELHCAAVSGSSVAVLLNLLVPFSVAIDPSRLLFTSVKEYQSVMLLFC